MDIKVSVIIPVYNCEEYLEEGILSLVNQSLQECEFIFINDGSTDKCLGLLRKYEVIDNRVRIIDQKNQGVSVARNQGLEIAIAHYTI